MCVLGGRAIKAPSTKRNSLCSIWLSVMGRQSVKREKKQLIGDKLWDQFADYKGIKLCYCPNNLSTVSSLTEGDSFSNEPQYNSKG